MDPSPFYFCWLLKSPAAAYMAFDLMFAIQARRKRSILIRRNLDFFLSPLDFKRTDKRKKVFWG